MRLPLALRSHACFRGVGEYLYLSVCISMYIYIYMYVCVVTFFTYASWLHTASIVRQGAIFSIMETPAYFSQPSPGGPGAKGKLRCEHSVPATLHLSQSREKDDGYFIDS